ncbi:xanthine dehydrogenase small subunit [Demetria terragena]|uniref:xanthine dehydrogenase small subunit n=1 Tax=Demetria terragena TaxID=63959 RepID=UPI00037FE297|nr:FAD binding domain-containing protein [Demetria terragena]
MHATVNGSARTLEVTSHTNALDWLRGQGLTGAKEGCAEGECGACAVLVARAGEDGGTTWTPINSCLIPAATLHGQEVVTSEGLGSPDDLHPVQTEMANRGGSQCGYCTPGFVCSMAAEYYRPGRAEAAPDASGESAHEHGPNGFDLHALSGNLCRCTGYRPIQEAAYALGEPNSGDPLLARTHQAPPRPTASTLEGPDGTFVRPRDLRECLDLIATHHDTVLVAGSTDWGVDANLKARRVPLLVAIDHLDELRSLEIEDAHITMGAALTLSEIERRLDDRIPLLNQMFPQFASRLIRNNATLGGNLGTGSPIGDAPPALLALEASLVLASRDGEREIPLADYFTGYRQHVRAAGELIKAVRIPLPLSTTSAFHKIAKRRFDDISSVAVGFALQIEGGMVRKARIGLGGVAATPLRAYATESALEGQPWDRSTVVSAARVMAAEGTPMDDHRASAAYRSAMLGMALRKLHADHAEVPR